MTTEMADRDDSTGGPRSVLNRRQLETLAAIAEVMIGAKGESLLQPADVAGRVDAVLSKTDSPKVAQICWLLQLGDLLFPLLAGRLQPFHSLPLITRTNILERIVTARWPSAARDIATTLKILSCVGYYSDERVMRALGYVPFDERKRASGRDQTRLHYIDPHPNESSL